jgi:hypothetical protein
MIWLRRPPGNNLERYLGLSIRRHLSMVVAQLEREAVLLQSALAAARSVADFAAVRRQLLAFRNRYTRVETTLDYYADAINTRTQPRIAGYLRACDTLAHRSMAQILDQLRKPTPVALNLSRQGTGRFDTQSRSSPLGSNRREPCGDHQDHPAQPASAYGADP